MTRASKRVRKRARSLEPGDKIEDFHLWLKEAEVASNSIAEEGENCEVRFRHPMLRNLVTTAVNGADPVKQEYGAFIDATNPEDVQLVIDFGPGHQRVQWRGLTEEGRAAAKTADVEQIAEVINERSVDDRVQAAALLLKSLPQELCTNLLLDETAPSNSKPKTGT